jgi:RNA polymerase sigma-70 factor (ECF subfamily)
VDETTRRALAAAAGDRAAFAALVRDTQDDVWRLCAHLVDVETAEDIAQDTYLRAARALRAFRADASARTWLLAIARRACADHLRRRVRRRGLQARVASSTEGPVEPAVDDAVELRLLLAGLDDDRREAFVLTQVLGLSYAEAAEVCGCPIGTIRSRVARARDDLATWLAGADQRRAGNRS